MSNTCFECGQPTQNSGISRVLCSVCTAAQMQIEALKKAERDAYSSKSAATIERDAAASEREDAARYAATERRAAESAQRARENEILRKEQEKQRKEFQEREQQRRDGQTRIQNLSEDPLKFIDSIKCFFVALNKFIHGGGIQEAKSLYSVHSLKLKMERHIDGLTAFTVERWYAHVAILELAGLPVNIETAEEWFLGFSEQKAKTSPSSIASNEIKIWLKKELTAYFFEQDKWNEKKNKNSKSNSTTYIRPTEKKSKTGLIVFGLITVTLILYLNKSDYYDTTYSDIDSTYAAKHNGISDSEAIESQTISEVVSIENKCDLSQIQNNIENIKDKNLSFKILGDKNERTYFFSAPFDNCKLKSFLISSDSVNGIEQYGNFTHVLYVNAKNKRVTQGWLMSEKLRKIEN